MHKFFKRYNLPKLNQEEIPQWFCGYVSAFSLPGAWVLLLFSKLGSHRQCSTARKKNHTQPQNKKLPTKSWTRQLHRKILSNIQRRGNSYPSEPIPKKTAEEGTLQNSCYEAIITLIPKPDKDMTKKIIGNITSEHRHKNLQRYTSEQHPTIH